MTVKLLTEYHSEFLSLTRDCTGSSESTLDKKPHCWKSHVMAHFITLIVSPARNGRHIVIISLSGLSAAAAVSHFWFLVSNFW